MNEKQPINRRNFFRQGLRQLLDPLVSALDLPEQSSRSVPVPLETWLRPPGALREQLFRETCSRCGECVKVCPAQCIKIDVSGRRGAGVPFIDADAMPCVVCESLACMNVCPTGALVPTALNDIDMGTAVWFEEKCVRSDGKDCTVCVDRCPLGSAAIELRDGRINVIEQGCIGCGVCQHYCPTHPKSIVVVPRSV